MKIIDTLARAQALFAILPLLFVALFIARVAPHRFQVTTALYPQPALVASDLVDAVGLVTRGRSAGLTIAVAGIDRETPTDCADAVGIQLAARLASAGTTVTIAVPASDACVGEIERRGLVWSSDPIATVRGADLLVYLGASLPTGFSLDQVAAVMRHRVILDAGLGISPDSARTHGIELVRFGIPAHPAWVEPELLRFADSVRRRLPLSDEGEQPGYLVLPRSYQTLHPRSRWYLALNYQLYPRRLYLSRPELASGRVGQFAQWSQKGVSHLPGSMITAEGERLRATWLIRYDQTDEFRFASPEISRIPPVAP